MANGTVTARATANDGSGKLDHLLSPSATRSSLSRVSRLLVPVSSDLITTDDGTLQLTAGGLSVKCPQNKTVTWSIVNGTGQGRRSIRRDLSQRWRWYGNSEGYGQMTAVGIRITHHYHRATRSSLSTGITVTDAGWATLITTMTAHCS